MSDAYSSPRLSGETDASRPELLAPAGSEESLMAAVRCGADAVYMGVSRFNARRNAENFSQEDLCRAVAYCHGRGVRVYLVLNTLVRQDEMVDALSTAKAACKAGVDALIVQDMGLARRIRRVMPHLPLHASTQTSCHTPAGVRALKGMGFSRVVLAREMTKKEIHACADAGCEREVFVHGALCMCVSGQCYLSAMLGGRSGNRGLCAQPCRLPFSSNAGCAGEGQAALSLRDLSLIAQVEALCESGVSSLKIEGRMKRPEYVAAAVSVCRAALQGEEVDKTLQQDLQAVFSRTGFTDGYYTDRRGEDMFGVRRKEDVLASGEVLGRLKGLYRHERASVPVTMWLTANTEEPLRLTVSDGKRMVTVSGDIPQEAQSRPLTNEDAVRQLGKTGGTPFYAEAQQHTIAPNVCVPMAALNALRRQALEELLAVREAEKPPYAGAFMEVKAEEIKENNTPAALAAALGFAYNGDAPLKIARLAKTAQLSATTKQADLWILPLSEAAGETAMPSVPWGVEIPRGMFGREDVIRRQLSRAKARGAVAALCGNIGAIPLAKEVGLCPIGGFGLNVMNGDTVTAYAEQGLKAATLSFELTLPQMMFSERTTIPTGLFVYGRQPLMLMRNCPYNCATGCDRCDKNGGTGLYDRKGAFFPVMCEGGCAELLNSVALDMAAEADRLPKPAFWLFHFTDESADEVEKTLRRYAKNEAATGVTTRGLYRRGVL